MRFSKLFLSYALIACTAVPSIASPDKIEGKNPTTEPVKHQKATTRPVEVKHKIKPKVEKVTVKHVPKHVVKHVPKHKKVTGGVTAVVTTAGGGTDTTGTETNTPEGGITDSGTPSIGTTTTGTSSGTTTTAGTGTTGTTTTGSSTGTTDTGTTDTGTTDTGSTSSGNTTGESGGTGSGSTTGTMSDAPELTPYVAFSWATPTSPLTHVVGTVWYTDASDPATIAQQLNALPEGERSLLRWSSVELLLGQTADLITGPDGNTYWGPWLANGAAAEAGFEDTFLTALQQDGATVDYLVLDTEIAINTWSVSPGQLNAIQTDPRWPALADEYGLTGLDIPLGYLDATSQAFALAMQVTQGQYMHEAFDSQVIAHFPGAHCSDFCDGVLSPAAAVEAPDLNGCVQPMAMPLHGDCQAPVYYATVSNIGQSWNNQGADFTTPLPVLCWQTECARGYAQSGVTSIPWFAGKTWTGGALANSPYYDELVFQTMLGGGSVNANLWIANATTLQEDCVAMDADLAALSQATGGAQTITPITTDAIPFTSSVVVSGAETPDGTQVYRITVPSISTRDQTVSVTLPGDDAATSITVPAGSAGTWFHR